MTAQKIIQVVLLYEERLASRKSFWGKAGHNLISPTKYEVIDHCKEMLSEIKELAKNNRIEKAFRWLGFVQGCFWSTGIYTIKELKDHNKP